MDGTATQNSEIVNIVRTAIVLSYKIPAELVPLVLDYAQLWPTIASARHSGEIKVSQRNAGLIFLSCTLPRGMPANTVRRIRFTTTSKDQGWSSYPNDQGTYGNSWTWFDAGVRHQQGQVDLASPPPGRQFVGGGEDYAHRSRIVTNLHAGKDFKTHTCIWDGLHNEKNIRDVVRQMRAGDTIELSMFAAFNGWENTLSFASIEVEGVYIRKL